ncbi:MAG: hypothetical protein C5B54_00390 [Acidobacteria bacterium]|nr:MAG: hypothetical protein C5B54_00390 [Acidobacteriota bacterium]
MMDVYSVLKEDHQEAKDLLEELEQTSNKAMDARERLLAELKNALETHMFLEETTFYSALRDSSDTSQLALKAFEEHQIIRKLVRELADDFLTEDIWGAKLKVVKENIENHFAQEEEIIFEMAQNVITDDRAEELGASVATKKAEASASRP